MSKWHGGKGSAPRPYSVTQEEYDNRWDAIFGRNKPATKESSDVEEHDEDLDEDTDDDESTEDTE